VQITDARISDVQIYNGISKLNEVVQMRECADVQIYNGTSKVNEISTFAPSFIIL
jgi:hypothetical protein